MSSLEHAFGQAGDKLKRDRDKAAAKRKKELARKRLVEQRVAKERESAARALEVANARREEEERARHETAEAVRQEELARTGGVKFSVTLRAQEWAGDSAGSAGDRVTLPPDALQVWRPHQPPARPSHARRRSTHLGHRR